MRNKKLLFILIPVVVIVLALIAGVVFLKLNSSPEKIFANSVSKVFGMFEASEEQFITMKGTMNLTANIESEDEDVRALNMMLGGASVGVDMELDTTNMIVNENLNVKYNNESLLKASILLQDEKGYVYLPDWLNKYIELPEEDMEYSELTEYYDKIATLDQNALMEAIKEELIKSISRQTLVQEDTTLTLDGQETKVIASTLDLKGQAIINFAKGFLTNLKVNEKFQTALGAFRADAVNLIDDMLTDDSVSLEDIHLVFTIYTKGFFSEVVGASCNIVDLYTYKGIGTLENGYGVDITTSFELLKHNDNKIDFTSYTVYGEERRNNLQVSIENKQESKNKGTATVTITSNREELIILYNYETQEDQTTFGLSTKIGEADFSILGNYTKNGNNYKGNIEISLGSEEIAKIKLNCAYDFTYGEEIQKVNVQNATLINELSEEDITILMTNFKKSELYQMLGQFGLSDFNLGYFSDNSQVKYDGYIVQYNIPENFKESEYSEEEYKMYMDENFNTINVGINEISVDKYMQDLDKEYILTSNLYKDQKISDVKSMNINGKEYKFRTITYGDEYGSYVNLYFAYELDDKCCYEVEVESEGGHISMDTVKYFLDITIE